ncbi:hypothetical protein IWW36_005058, partial [Coemansia brasiliensis]
GYYNRKVSAVALMRLLDLHDARVNSLVVQGDLIPNTANNGKIVTRSMSRVNPDQFTQIAAPVKIFKLLLAEIDMDVESMYVRNGGAGLSAVVDANELDTGDGDEDNWEDDGIEDAGLADELEYYAHFADDEFDDDDDDDEDVQADPIYHQDLNETLGSYLKQITCNENFGTSIAPLLTSREQSILSKM